MLARILVGVTITMSGAAADSRADAKRSFLMLNDQSIEFVNGAPVLGHWRVSHRWDEKENRPIEVVDGVEFVTDKQFWKMISENIARHSARSEVRLEKDGRLFYRDKPVELGLRVRSLDSVLRWHNWIVAVGFSDDPPPRPTMTIKGPVSFLFWFDEKTLKGSYRQLLSGVTPPLRIYSK